MCGFAGYLNQTLHLDEGVLDKMGASIKHRGPDSRGTYRYENFALVHNRLSIIDLSDAASQPMISNDGRYVIAFNGEIYNFRDIQRQLNLNQTGDSDTKALVNGFALIKTDILNELNGMFAFVVFDKESKEVTLCRDRFGIKPLYYYWDGKNLVFGSEVKAIMKALKDLEINQTALHDFLYLEYIPGNQSIFKKIKKIEPGTYMTLNRDGNLSSHTYYDLINKTGNIKQKSPELMEEFEQLLSSSIKYRSISDVPMGAFLSGGVDSSLICALYQEQNKESIKTFNIGFHEQEFDESRFANEVSRQLGTAHSNYVLTESDALQLVEKISLSYDEPFAVPSVIPMLKLSSNTRESVKVALSGDGADELFMGYGYYTWWKRLNALQKTGGDTLIHLLSKSLEHVGPRYKRVARLLNHSDLPQYWTHVWSQEQYMFTESEVSEFTGVSYRHETLNAVWNQLNESKLSDFEKISLLDLKFYLSDDLLHKVDIASMASGLEVRLPFLDHRLVEFCLTLPESLKIDGNIKKVLPKKLLSRFISNDLVNRTKWGFPAPMNHWLTGQLTFLIEKYLNKQEMNRHGLIDPIPVDRLIKSFQSGENWHYKRIWALINFQMWYTNHMD